MNTTASKLKNSFLEHMVATVSDLPYKHFPNIKIFSDECLITAYRSHESQNFLPWPSMKILVLLRHSLNKKKFSFLEAFKYLSS